MSEFKKGDKVVFVSKDISNYTGNIFTFEKYYDSKLLPKLYLWVEELSGPFQSSYFRLATLLEIELQS